MRENETALLNYFERRISGDADAAEAFGEFLLVAWKLHRKMPVDRIEARMWLYGVAHNVLRNSRRALARQSTAVRRFADAMPPTIYDPSDDTAFAVREAIASLPSDDEELVRLIYWDGLASHEAAAVLGINASTARSRLSRAKKELKTALTDTFANR